MRGEKRGVGAGGEGEAGDGADSARTVELENERRRGNTLPAGHGGGSQAPWGAVGGWCWLRE